MASQLELSNTELATQENLRQLDTQSAVCRCKKAQETGYDSDECTTSAPLSLQTL